MSASPTLDPAQPTEAPDDLALRAKVLKAILIIGVIDLLLFLPLIYGLAAGDPSLKKIFGMPHGIGFMLELGLTYWGVANKWWGWWYPVLTLVTTGPPGAIIGHGKAKREALGA
ncbi:MAG: hypothetical protein PGN13_12900 [Patulibacter minatonensis]